MVVEPQRSQYLEAMGLTAWVGRYRLPNAAPTPQCEWHVPEAAPEQPPAQRLHALLDDAERAPSPTAAHTPAASGPETSQSKRARALLEQGDSASEPDVAAAPASAAEPPRVAAPVERAAALRFTLQVAALDGRWLILLPDGHEPDATAQRLLASLLHAAGIVPGAAPAFQAFNWPMMEGLPVEAPLDEARDGLRAFVEGRRKRGWRPERLLMFGDSDVLAPVLELEAGQCRLLGIAGWQGPSLRELAHSAAAKRALWSALAEWREAWHCAADGDDPAH